MKLLLVLLFTISINTASADEITFTKEADRIVFKQSDQPLCEYVFSDDKIPRPYFTRLHAPDGIQVTRNHPPVAGEDPTDHTNLHPGLWLAFGDLNGVDFWRNKGRVEHVKFLSEPQSENGRVEFSVEDRYLAKNGDEVCRDVNTYALVPGSQLKPPQPGTLLMWNTVLTGKQSDLTLGPQHEMGLGFA